MTLEPLSTSRHLVGGRLRMSDAEVHTKYVFPFVDESWTVPFLVVDAMTYGPRVFRGAVEMHPGGLETAESPAKLEPVSTLQPSVLEKLVHFDPWWAFRGTAGVDRTLVNAILASNIAGTFNHEGTTYKLHDLEFDARLKQLEGLVGKDPVFRSVTFRKGDLDLLPLRKPPRK